jgi:hypothetical protein
LSELFGGGAPPPPPPPPPPPLLSDASVQFAARQQAIDTAQAYGRAATLMTGPGGTAGGPGNAPVAKRVLLGG